MALFKIWTKHSASAHTGGLLRGVPEVLSNISLVFGDRDLVFYMKVLYYGTFDNQKMI